jgi:hypothetical protein
MTSIDCLCALCGACKHDHGGWQHPWTPKEVVADGGREEDSAAGE